jgi:UDP-N-acetylglucosamine transferase subunit ALG13
VKIFVTLGFEQSPFDRLLKAIDEGIHRQFIPEATLVQKGHSQYTLRRCPSVPFLSFAEMHSALKSAEIVVSHAGVGTLLQCLHLNKIPILFPRFASQGEHVDNHQVDFARSMEEHKKALVAYDHEQLWRTVGDYGAHVEELSGADCGNGTARLCDYLRERLEKIQE